MYKNKYSEYATIPEKSRGRIYKESQKSDQNIYQEDITRIITCDSFRRLENKTQVFINSIGNHYRTRLTHSLEVANISKIISKPLGLNENVAEAISLIHDIGHPPFGHAGEIALNEVSMEYGGFEHNAHAIELITNLEKKHANFPGLNLTWEILEGVLKHNGPIVNEKNHSNDISVTYKNLQKKGDFLLDKFTSLEAQISGLSDDIAYCSHDLEDGFRADFITLKDIEKLDFIDIIALECKKKYPEEYVVNEIIRVFY